MCSLRSARRGGERGGGRGERRARKEREVLSRWAAGGAPSNAPAPTTPPWRARARSHTSAMGERAVQDQGVGGRAKRGRRWRGGMRRTPPRASARVPTPPHTPHHRAGRARCGWCDGVRCALFGFGRCFHQTALSSVLGTFSNVNRPTCQVLCRSCVLVHVGPTWHPTGVQLYLTYRIPGAHAGDVPPRAAAHCATVSCASIYLCYHRCRRASARQALAPIRGALARPLLVSIHPLSCQANRRGASAPPVPCARGQNHSRQPADDDT